MGLGTIGFIWRHPLARRHRSRALARWLAWQARSRLVGGAIVVPFAGASRLRLTPGMTGATGNFYAGLHDFEDMAFVLHALRPGDLFMDVGANVGSYSVLAGAVAGADVVAFEPVAATYGALIENVRLNGLEGRVRAQQVGVGRTRGTLAFTTGHDVMNHVAVGAATGVVEEVPVTTLDDEGPSDLRPVVVKLDVEGWEAEVLEGAGQLLGGAAPRALIVELNGSGARYGYADADTHARLLGLGYVPAAYAPFRRSLTRAGGPAAVGNTLYVNDFAFFTDRVATAAAVDVFGESL